MTEAEFHVLVRLIQEKTSLHVAGNMAIRAAIELIQQRGYVITPPKPTEQPMTDETNMRRQRWRRVEGDVHAGGTDASGDYQSSQRQRRSIMKIISRTKRRKVR